MQQQAQYSSIKTFVLPVPAFADTKTDLSGEAASR